MQYLIVPCLARHKECALGRQVNFYMAKEDEDQFLSFAKGTGDVVLLPPISSTSDFQSVDVLPEPFSADLWRQFWLFNRSIVSSFQSEYDSQRSYYMIDGLGSSLVEFSRSYVKDNTMYPGRIWANFTIVDDESGDLAQKDRQFRNWYESLAKWIRKEFYHTGWLVFAGRGALRFQDQGGTLP